MKSVKLVIIVCVCVRVGMPGCEHRCVLMITLVCIYLDNKQCIILSAVPP